MWEIIKLAVDFLVLRDAQRKHLLNARMIAMGFAFALFLYLTALPATLLYQQHPQYKPLFIAALAVDVIATVVFMWYAIRDYLHQLRVSRPSDSSNSI